MNRICGTSSCLRHLTDRPHNTFTFPLSNHVTNTVCQSYTEKLRVVELFKKFTFLSYKRKIYCSVYNSPLFDSINYLHHGAESFLRS